MNQYLFIALFAVGLPLSFGNYENAADNADSLKDIGMNGGNPIENAHMNQLQEDWQAINSNPSYNSYKNNEFITQKLLESSFVNKVRNGDFNIVSPNVIDQASYRSLLVPSGHNTEVIANNPLPPVVVHQAATAPITVNSGPAAVIRSSPVIYKIKPSVIYQNELIHKIPSPINLNPIYLKVFKAGKTIDVPVDPIVQKSSAPSYNLGNSYESSHPAAYQPSPSSY